jgi:MORN repeat
MKKNPDRIKRKPSVKIGTAPDARSEFPKPLSAAQRIHQSSISPSPKPTNRIAVSAIELRPRDPSADQPPKNRISAVADREDNSAGLISSSLKSRDQSRDKPAPAPSVAQIHLQAAENTKRNDLKEGILRQSSEINLRGTSRDSEENYSQLKQLQREQEKSQYSPRAGATNSQIRSSSHSPELGQPGRSQNPAAPVTNVAATTRPIAIRGTLVDGWHRVDFENGVYEGYIRDNKRHEEGTYVWSDGSRYQGQWADDLKHGTGKFVWTTGDVFEGEYLRDKRHGSGIKTYASGDRYEVGC